MLLFRNPKLLGNDTKKLKSIKKKTDRYDAIIWNNHEIKIATKSIFYESWNKAGVTKVKHLLDPNSGKFPTYQEFVNIFKVKPSFTVYYGLLSAIKNKWKISHTGRQKQTQKQSWYDNEENLSNAALHKIIVENKFQQPTNENQVICYGMEPSEISGDKHGNKTHVYHPTAACECRSISGGTSHTL